MLQNVVTITLPISEANDLSKTIKMYNDAGWTIVSLSTCELSSQASQGSCPTLAISLLL
ncbi:MAG: hypothetical protein HUK20_13190 [Fibrobacter sp.]|nr:hypothetical protein [Fibrobacter sp.]